MARVKYVSIDFRLPPDTEGQLRTPAASSWAAIAAAQISHALETVRVDGPRGSIVVDFSGTDRLVKAGVSDVAPRLTGVQKCEDFTGIIIDGLESVIGCQLDNLRWAVKDVSPTEFTHSFPVRKHKGVISATLDLRIADVGPPSLNLRVESNYGSARYLLPFQELSYVANKNISTSIYADMEWPEFEIDFASNGKRAAPLYVDALQGVCLPDDFFLP